jgi:hypothetical protein
MRSPPPLRLKFSRKLRPRQTSDRVAINVSGQRCGLAFHFQLELRQASTSHTTASNFDEADNNGIRDLPCGSPKGRPRVAGDKTHVEYNETLAPSSPTRQAIWISVADHCITQKLDALVRLEGAATHRSELALLPSSANQIAAPCLRGASRRSETLSVRGVSSLRRHMAATLPIA